MEDRMRPAADSAPEGGSRNLLAVLRRRILIMMPVSLIIIIAAVGYAVVQPRVYEASTWMLISAAGGRPDAGMLLTEADVWRSLQGDISLHVRLIQRAEMGERVREALGMEEPIYSVVERVSVERVPGASANLLSISIRSRDPDMVKILCDTWAKEYEADSRERGAMSTVSAIEYVDAQIEAVESDLRDLEGEMAFLEQDYLSTGISITSGHGAERLSGVIGQLGETRVEIQALQAQIDRTRSRLAEEPEEIEEVQEQPSHRATAIEQQLSQLHIQYQTTLQDYYEDSPEVRSLREQIARLEVQLEEGAELTRSAVTTQTNPVYLNTQNRLIELYGQLDSLQARRVALQTQFGEQRVLAEMAPAGSIAYNELMRRAQGLQSVHASLLSRLYDLQLKRAMTVSPVQVVREADQPQAPVSPQYRSIIAIGIVAALLLGLLAAVAVDQIDDTFSHPDEIREALNTRLVGVLPPINGEVDSEIQVGLEGSQRMTRFANAVRMLASTVRIEMYREELHSLTVTSAGRSEGKSLTAGNLAAALAGAGERVLLIDCDMHIPRLHVMYGLKQEPGLSNLLMGALTAEQVMQETSIENLTMISAGPAPPSPVDLLASAHGRDVIEQLNKTADYVIWDTPPAGFLADATVVSHQTDRVLFVVGARARRSAVIETVQNLRDIGARLLGVCANQVRPSGRANYYYGQDE